LAGGAAELADEVMRAGLGNVGNNVGNDIINDISLGQHYQ
jgi:hypothetical protein